MTCISCQTNKGTLECAGCKEALCKSCAQFVDEHTFAFLPKLPGNIVVGSYCIQCYDTNVRPEAELYEAQLELAHDVDIYTKNQGKEVTYLKRAATPVKVEMCEDKDEALLRLAFLTAQAGYDTVVAVELSPIKTYIGSYQKAVWNATGIPAIGPRKKKRG